jgi:hypothetical protein
MKKIMLALGLTFGAATVALAQDAPVVTDTDGNGTYSMEELMVTYPDLTAEVFATVDANGDGQVDADELKAAQEAGTLKVPG